MSPTLGFSWEAMSSVLLLELVMPCTGLCSLLLLLEPSSPQLLFIYLLWTFCMAHLGYLHLTKPMTLYLADRL